MAYNNLKKLENSKEYVVKMNFRKATAHYSKTDYSKLILLVGLKNAPALCCCSCKGSGFEGSRGARRICIRGEVLIIFRSYSLKN